MKKKLEVTTLINWVNAQLERKDDEATRDYKKGLCSLLESMLHQTGNYEGFAFLNFEDSAFNTNAYWSRKYFVNPKLLK